MHTPSNPEAATHPPSHQGNSIKSPMAPLGNCKVTRTNSKGVGAGDGQDDGEVTMVICPRNPYCSGNTGKFKVMWWWDNKQMQDFAIIDPNF